MSRVPERVSVDSGPSLASENGNRLRTSARALQTASFTDAAALKMPSLNVSSSLTPESYKFMPARKFSASVHAARSQSPMRNRSAKAMRDAQKFSQTRPAMSAAVAQSPLNTAATKRTADTSVSSPRTTFVTTVASASKHHESTEPSIFPALAASLAAPVISTPNTRETRSPSPVSMSLTSNMTGVSADTAPLKLIPSHIPAKNSLMRKTIFPTDTTSFSSPAARMSRASSPRISEVEPVKF